jgi:GT2 family glycosyltransferase
MDVSIIIVNYNTKNLIHNCLLSIYRQTKNIDFEVIVSDNDSIDGSVEMIKVEFPKVILIENKINLGFGAANNRGLDIAKGKYILYLNSDTVLFNNAIKIFYDFWESYPEPDKLGAIGCNLFDENFNITYSYENFPTIFNTIKRLIRINITLSIKTILCLFKYDYQKLRKKIIYKQHIGMVDYIIGADLFMKNDKNIRYDERFFLYYEETELQYRLSLFGKKRLLIDGPVIQHLMGGSNKIGKDDDLRIYSSSARIHSFISGILYFLITNKLFGVMLIKFLVICIFCNPYLIFKTFRYIPKVILCNAKLKS